MQYIHLMRNTSVIIFRTAHGLMKGQWLINLHIHIYVFFVYLSFLHLAAENSLLLAPIIYRLFHVYTHDYIKLTLTVYKHRWLTT